VSAVCFTDQCTFTLNKESNVENTPHWPQQIPRVNIPTRSQNSQKINIWAGIFNDNIIGPFEIEGNSPIYLVLLATKVGPTRENKEIWFQ
jgi:hypothetical protein